MEGDTVRVGMEGDGGVVGVVKVVRVEETEMVKLPMIFGDMDTPGVIEGKRETVLPPPSPPVVGVESKGMEGDGVLVMVPPCCSPAVVGVGSGGEGEMREDGVPPPKGEAVPPA